MWDDLFLIRNDEGCDQINKGNITLGNNNIKHCIIGIMISLVLAVFITPLIMVTSDTKSISNNEALALYGETFGILAGIVVVHTLLRYVYMKWFMCKK